MNSIAYTKSKYVWYASYGSNLSKNRFYCYVEGGQIKEYNISESGCRDKSLPLQDKKLILNNELCFVEQSQRWQNKGVAVIDAQPSLTAKTYARMYLIKKNQFRDIVKQENGIQVDENLDFSFPDYIEGNSIVIFAGKRYGRILYVGQDSGWPIFTFTTSQPVEKLLINQPSESYLKMIASGIKETYGISSMEMAEYFINLKGVKDNYQLEQLADIFNSIDNEI